MSAPRRILMIAYHFPPLAGSSGIQRTLRFVQHLPTFGWEPLVLTAHPRAYERTSEDLAPQVPAATVVRRAFALDTARHLAFRGRYIAAMARPDRWTSWRFDGVRQGMDLVRRYRPSVIWSTYPIATAHLIGAELHRRTGLPWIADFRDPMAQDGYPPDPATWAQYSSIEAKAMQQARLSIFTTPSAAQDYRHRYPEAASRICVLENGYDEESFAGIEASTAAQPLNEGAVTLLHSGIVYPEERDPSALILALRRLHDGGVIAPGRMKVRFRAAVAEALLRRLATEHGVEAYVEICPPLPYLEALSEMMRADGLLIMQASNCNAQIPAKLYEYLRAGRPVLCLSDPAGDTARTLQAAGVEAMARLDDPGDIARLLQRFIESDPTLPSTRAGRQHVLAASRRGRTEALATHLSKAIE